jgi:Domain of unknown function (DUF4190)
MTDPEEPDALVPPPFTEQQSGIPGQAWPGAGQQQPPQYGPQYGPPPGYPPQQYQYGYGYGYPPPPRARTNGMAIAAMICGICGFLCLVPGVVGIILGAVSLPQIKRAGQNGRGMAITGIVMGLVWIAAFVLLVALGNHSNGQVQFGNSGPGDGSNIGF